LELSNIKLIVSRQGLCVADHPGGVATEAVDEHGTTVEVTDVGKGADQERVEGGGLVPCYSSGPR